MTRPEYSRVQLHRALMRLIFGMPVSGLELAKSKILVPSLKGKKEMMCRIEEELSW